MKTKPKTPYQRLLDDIKDFCSKVRFRHEAGLFWYRKDKLRAGHSLDDLYERVAAAEQLGYEVYLVAKDDGLHARYRKKAPEVPYGWRK